PSEDVEDETAPVDDPELEVLLEIPVLRGREVVVEEEEVRLVLVPERANLLDLALAQERGGAHGAAALEHLAEDLRPGRLGEEAQLGQRVAVMIPARRGATGQDRAFLPAPPRGDRAHPLPRASGEL